MRRALRILSKILDYSWFYGILVIFMDLFSAGIFYYIFAALMLPILFIPVETLSLKLFGSTLGKILFGFRYHRKLSFKESLTIAFKKALLIQPLFLPGINLFFIYLYIKELVKYPNNRWDSIDGSNVIHRRLKWHTNLACLLTALFLTTVTIVPESLLQRSAQIVGIESADFMTRFAVFKPGDWVKVTPDDYSFSIFFPKSPDHKQTNYDVPNSERKLTVKEYSHKEDITYRLTYAELPSSWTFFGSSVVFRSVIKLIEKHEGTIHKHYKCTHNRYPAMEYNGLVKDGKLYGKSILVKNTIYRVEAISKNDLSDTQKEKVVKFMDSFSPRS